MCLICCDLRTAARVTHHLDQERSKTCIARGEVRHPRAIVIPRRITITDGPEFLDGIPALGGGQGGEQEESTKPATCTIAPVTPLSDMCGQRLVGAWVNAVDSEKQRKDYVVSPSRHTTNKYLQVAWRRTLAVHNRQSHHVCCPLHPHHHRRHLHLHPHPHPRPLLPPIPLWSARLLPPLLHKSLCRSISGLQSSETEP